MAISAQCYSPRNDTNCKGYVGGYRRRRLNQRTRREFSRLIRGMDAGPCWFVTLIRGHCTDFSLRCHVWHVALTRLRQRWPEAQAWTIYEWNLRRGVHLHVVLRGVDGIDCAWLEHVVALADAQAAVGDFQLVYDGARLARYLLKQLPDAKIATGWPRNFRPVSTTREWAPEWQSDEDWSATRRRPLGGMDHS